MKTRLILAVMILLVVAAGCSPTIGKWTERGTAGVAIASRNIDALAGTLRAGLVARELRDIDALFADIAAVRDGAIKLPDGEVIEMDDAWLAEAKNGLHFQRALWAADRAKLDAAVAMSKQNLDHIRLSFENIDRLRKSYGTRQELAAEVQQLSTLVQALLAKEAP